MKDKSQKRNEQSENKENKVIQLGKKHFYTRSKLALSPLNKIFISPDTVRYDTARYTFLKKCHFRNREEDRELNEINKACTTEFMRKIDLKLKGKYYLSPDKRRDPIVNPLLQIDNLGNEANIQLLSYSQEKNNQNGERYMNNTKNNKIQLVSHNIDKNNQNKIKDKQFKNNSHKIETVNPDYYKKEDKKENSKENEDNTGGNINILDVKSDSDSGSIKIEEKIETIKIPKEYIAKCRMGEIIINKNKDKNESNNKEEEIKEKEVDVNERFRKG